MGPVSIGFGLFLIVLGLAGYFVAGHLHPEKQSWTALIPAIFGVLLIVLGLLARKDRLRMHVMHAAALLGLVGFVMPGWRVVRGLLLSDTTPDPIAITAQAAMSLACLVYVGLCVKSFIDARRRRKNQAGSPQE